MKLPADLKEWCAISCPIDGIRLDRRMLELMDTNHDGYIRTDEVKAAVEFVEAHKEASVRELPEILSEIEAERKLVPPDLEYARLHEAALTLRSLEAVIDAYFLPAEDAPLITDEPEKILPLAGKVNLRYLAAFDAFVDKCVRAEFGAEKSALTYREWTALKAKLGGYLAERTPDNGSKLAALEEEERLCRYRAHLEEFLRNFVTMDALYAEGELASFQMGVLRIDGRELSLCFQVNQEGAHSELCGKSNCFVMYLKLTKPEKGVTNSICAVVTAGTALGLYVGRNGVFYDRDGEIWQAVVTKVVENQVSLSEAFWAPWKKLGEGMATTVKKFLGERQSAAMSKVPLKVGDGQANGAALASSVAAIGIGVGMVGAALASLMAMVSKLTTLQLIAVIPAVILLVSVPSVILAWFKLRRRDLGVILNASGWAINRELKFSMRHAQLFTKCVPNPVNRIYAVMIAVVILAGVVLAWCQPLAANAFNQAGGESTCTTNAVSTITEVK